MFSICKHSFTWLMKRKCQSRSWSQTDHTWICGLLKFRVDSVYKKTLFFFNKYVQNSHFFSNLRFCKTHNYLVEKKIFASIVLSIYLSLYEFFSTYLGILQQTSIKSCVSRFSFLLFQLQICLQTSFIVFFSFICSSVWGCNKFRLSTRK